jgi:transcriptional regulator with XRE-family HTH domain
MARARKKPEANTLTDVIAGRIRTLGLTHYAVGKMAGIDAATIMRFANGERTLTLRTAEKLCQALDLVLVVRPDSTLSLDLLREREERAG